MKNPLPPNLFLKTVRGAVKQIYQGRVELRPCYLSHLKEEKNQRLPKIKNAHCPINIIYLLVNKLILC